MQSFLFFFLVLGRLATSVADCPPPGFDALEDFEFEKYVPGLWYSIRQAPIAFQTEDELFCTTARYDADESRSLGCVLFGWLFGCNDPVAIAVFNSGRRDSVTGDPIYIDFRGIIPDQNQPAKVNVGPTFVPDFLRFGTNYWVVAAGTYDDLPSVVGEDPSDVYQYALITGGEPTEDGQNGLCSGNSGTWILARDPFLPDGALADLEAKFQALGIDTSPLLTVPHEGCDYNIQSSGNPFIEFFNVIFQGVETLWNVLFG